MFRYKINFNEGILNNKKISRFIIFPFLYELLKMLLNSFVFFILLDFYFIPKVIIGFQRLLHLPKFIVNKQEHFSDYYSKRAVNFFDKQMDIKKWELIDLAFKTMFSKKTRTAVTIGGMAIGIGATVFLLSIGYGTEKLVKSRVANLNQIKQTDITSLNSKQLPINNAILKDILKIKGVKNVLPIVSVVGKVDYKGSEIDVVVYASDSDYLIYSDLKPVKGEFYKTGKTWERDFENKDVTNFVLNKNITQYINRDLNSKKSAPQSTETTQKINEVLGISTNNTPSVPTSSSTTNNIPVDTPPTKTDSTETLQKLEAINLQEAEYQKLLESTLFSGDIDFNDPEIYNILPEIEPEDTSVKEVEINLIEEEILKEVIVTTSFLEALNIETNDAVGKSFNIKFTLVGDLIPKLQGRKATSKSEEYTIKAVVQNDSPFIYIPLKDIKTLGVVNYSQAKVVAENEGAVLGIREKIEGLGFETQSVQDTLERIESLFGGIRVALLMLGALALSIAALGMFNTLTVSLLERTHEVGLLKSLGMKSREVKEMFLAESLILGFFGGTAGVFLGFTFGKILDIILSAFSLSAGQGVISITHIPFALIAFTLILSYLIGVFTGYYPSKRATKISALNALRYE